MKIKRTCACEGATLKKFIQPVILSLLSSSTGTAYQLCKGMSAYATLQSEQPDMTGVYRTIKSMEARGLVEKVDEGQTESVYRITDQGKSCLAQWKQTLTQYSRSLEQLVREL